jgi:hypothetical protein
MKTTLLAILLLAAAGCGTPKPQTPKSTLPNMTGTWVGAIYLTPSGTAYLTVVLSQDSSGKLTGTAESTSGCSFYVPVSGAIYANSTFSVSSPDFTTLSMPGQMTSSTEASGYLNVDAAGCGNQASRPFALGRQ